MGKDVAVAEKSELEVALRKMQNRFPGMRSEADLKFVQEISFMLAIVRGSEQLQQCTMESMQDALLQAASFGLSFNPTLGHCYLIPRKLKRGDNRSPTIAYASPGYRGMLARAIESKGILWAQTDVVYSKDAFQVRGTSQEPLHNFDVFKPRGAIVGAYVFVKTLDGSYLTEWMHVDEIEAARKKSEAKNSMMWTQFYPEACKKCVIRRAWKRWPRKVQDTLVPLMEQLNKHEGLIVEGSEAVEIIGDERVLELHALLTDHGLDSEKADKWLFRLSQTFGVTKIEDLPADKFNDAKAKLEALIKEHVK